MASFKSLVYLLKDVSLEALCLTLNQALIRAIVGDKKEMVQAIISILSGYFEQLKLNCMKQSRDKLIKSLLASQEDPILHKIHNAIRYAYTIAALQINDDMMAFLLEFAKAHSIFIKKEDLDSIISNLLKSHFSHSCTEPDYRPRLTKKLLAHYIAIKNALPRLDYSFLGSAINNIQKSNVKIFLGPLSWSDLSKTS